MNHLSPQPRGLFKALIAVPALAVAVLCSLPAQPLIGAPAGSLSRKPIQPKATPTFQNGDVFVAGSSSNVEWRKPDGTLVKLLDVGFTVNTGMAFDKQGRLYVTCITANKVIRFDTEGNRLGEFGSGYSGPESIVFDAAGNAYVGNTGDGKIVKLDKDGNLLDQFDTSGRNDWIDLAADQKTIFRDTEQPDIHRFDVSARAALTDFTTTQGGSAFALRILPDKGLLVASGRDVERFDSTGSLVKTYDVAGIDFWFAANLDPDGKTFWSADIGGSARVVRFNLTTGDPVFEFTAQQSVFGLAIKGEITAAQPQGVAFVTAPTSIIAGQAADFTAQATGDNGAPLANAKLIFQIIASSTGNLGLRKAVTAPANGQAPFSFAPAFPGTDTVQVTFDKNGNGRADAGEPTDTRTITVTDAASTDLAHVEGTGFTGSRSCPGLFDVAVSYGEGTTGDVPTGTLSFDIPRRNFHFRADSLTALVVTEDSAGHHAIIFGTGTVNGSGMVPFRVDALDTRGPAVGHDRFDIEFLQDINHDNSPDLMRQGGVVLGPSSGDVSVTID
jgi:hypothetical protein